MWGIVGNFTRPSVFVTDLTPFWFELLDSVIDGGPEPHHHIIVFSEESDSGITTAHEIFLRNGDGRIEIRTHECAFSLSQ